MKFACVVIIVACMFVSCNKKSEDQKQETKNGIPYVVMISLDAFRWDYPLIYNTPTLDSIALAGVKAASLQPCFPSKTFPNHYSMATGLYPENHGIVMNSFDDSHLGFYSLSKREAVQNAAFYGGEPIWVTAEKQGVQTACYFWPGSEAPVKGTYPGIWKQYDGRVPFEARLDSVVSWLKLPHKNRPNLILCYLQEPDGVGHNYGPESVVTQNTVESLDKLIGDFCRKLNKLACADSVNLIITSDHGMGAISPDRVVLLHQYIPNNWVKAVYGGNPAYLIRPATEAFADSILKRLQTVKHIHGKRKNDLPESFHYSENKRIEEIVVYADSAWSVCWNTTVTKIGGAHGYDPRNSDMHAIFYASGPGFKRSYVHPTFENIHLYPIIAELLGLNPSKTDGRLELVKEMLQFQNE